MLGKLGEGLRGLISKITGKGIIDKEAIEEIVKDIQRTLLSGDVEVKLVFDLSNRIRTRAMEPPAPGLTTKEHIINIVYDEIVKLLGDKQADIPIKPTRILLIGLFGSGKCVHPNTLVTISNGDIVKVKDLYEAYKIYGENKLEDGYIIDVSNKNLIVPSFNQETLKVENKKVTHLWKLNGKELLQVKLDNGNDFSVRVTPEHPFFVLRNGSIVQVRADQLSVEDYVAIPKLYNTNTDKVDLYADLKKLNLVVYENSKLVKETILSKYSTLKNAYKTLRSCRNYARFTSSIKRGVIPIEFIERLTADTIKIKLRQNRLQINFPVYMTEELAEFLGYVIGDGHLNEKYVQISNEDQEVIRQVVKLSNDLFGIKASVNKDSRTNKMYDIRIASKTLVHILNRIFDIPIGKKGKEIRIPHQVTKSNNDIIKMFLKAYFDCDAYADPDSRDIELSSESKILISNTQSLLLRLGISSTLSKKYINSVPYFRLHIRSNSAEIYADKIGFSILRKHEIAKTYKNIGLKQSNGKEEEVPLGNMLKHIRTSLGFSIGEIQHKCNSYGQYEKNGVITRESLSKLIKIYENNKLGNHYKFLKALNESSLKEMFSRNAINYLTSYSIKEGLIIDNGNTLSISDRGIALLNNAKAFRQNLIQYLKILSTSDVIWSRVTEISEAENKEGFVYDLTVEDNHSFIADNIIVHNTTTSGKLANFYKKRGLKPALIGCDVHRPAAMDQLKQIAEKLQIPCYIDKSEKDATKILKKGLETIDAKIIIVDSAGRDALDQDLIKEIKSISEILNPEEVLLIIPGDIGQIAKRQAEEFKKALNITGVVITKLDSTAKGGGALSACYATGAKVKFIGLGEKIEDLEIYDPKRFVSRLLGMGDLESLLEKVKEIDISEKSAEDILKGDFTLKDFYDHLESMRKLGPLKKIAEMIPGMGQMNIPDDLLNMQESKLKKFKYIMESMNKKELENPETIDASRINRIAKGSGTKPEDVKELIKQYKQSKKMLKMFKGGRPKGPFKNLLKNFKGF